MFKVVLGDPAIPSLFGAAEAVLLQDFALKSRRPWPLFHGRNPGRSGGGVPAVVAALEFHGWLVPDHQPLVRIRQRFARIAGLMR